MRSASRSLATVLALVVIASAEAQVASNYDVRAYGARADGSTNDAGAINRAIAVAAVSGGTVDFPAGQYLTGSIHLRSHVTLHLSDGAVLIASSSAEDYDHPEPNAWGDQRHYQDFGHSHWHDSLLWGEGLEDVAITGPGRIWGRGLSRGWDGERAPQPVGNKAISLLNCRRVLLRDFTIQHGGWFGLLATGVDDLTVDHLMIDTNRDGMDIDCCRNVRVVNCSVNSPYDDGICLKSSFGLGRSRATEDVTISDCLVCGYDEGTLLDGSRRHADPSLRDPTGRIKFGTESNGGFKAITITNCVFECCRGLALESVDGARLENVTISNLAMHQIFGAPIFLRLGERMRGPVGVPVGVLRHVLISDVVADGVASAQGVLITGVPGHAIEDVTLSNISLRFEGGASPDLAHRELPEMERTYPEPISFGPTPAWAMVLRHARGIVLRNVSLRTEKPDGRPAFWLQDLEDGDFGDVRLPAGLPMVQHEVSRLVTWHCSGAPDSAAPP